ncbi:hypothetical protein D1953_02055 [Peribacillus asahii]|uniref:Uncharacterized protein n=2 Tax=Peribacillus asahii TaxID=228899 RepID=A0A398BGR4_9BACI|nr:hypothetical protein D1953_02055 [Peribacillus asahii]
MMNLKQGIVTIDGFTIDSKTKYSEVVNNLKNRMKTTKIDEVSDAIRFLSPVQLGSKKFFINIFFANELIQAIELCVADPSINEWDYKALIAQHGEWLTEQIGYPEGVLDDNVYDWGKINQWEDFRSRDAGISILYFQNRECI